MTSHDTLYTDLYREGMGADRLSSEVMMIVSEEYVWMTNRYCYSMEE